MTQVFEIWYFYGARVGGMDVFSGFVELSFPSLNKCAVCVGSSALSVKHHRKKANSYNHKHCDERKQMD